MTKRAKKKHIPLTTGTEIGGWTLERRLGEGGNGDVWKACRPGSSPHAIKFLRKTDEEAYSRFKTEIEILKQITPLAGIVPLIDQFIPESKADGTPWFVMPLAIPFDEYIKDKMPMEIVAGFIELGSVMEELHRRGISHRDIKPANFLFLDGRLCLADFGLVKFPEKLKVTPERRDVGAKFTMAPEMRRVASAADGLPADVYSLAKSLWIALTGVELGFDGQYNAASIQGLRNYVPRTYTTTLDRLITECTDDEPSRRPKVTSFVARLREWVTIISDFDKRNLAEWTELSHKLFPLGMPERATWQHIDSICAVLAEIAGVQALNHMFYPDGGGNTITGVSRAAEPGLIVLHVGGIRADLLRPAKLTYESFGNAANWNYFRLEAEILEPTGQPHSLDSKGRVEALTEIKPGFYAPYHCWDNGEYHGEPLPELARPVSRYLEGSFVLFSTYSPYNRTPSTYDARHNKMGEEEFRHYIAQNVAMSS